MKVYLLLLFSLTITPDSYSQRINIDSFCLKSLDDKNIHLKNTDKLTLLVFLSPECPLSGKYMFTLNQLFDKYKSTVLFVGVFPGSDYPDSTYKQFEKKYDPHFILAKDDQLQLVLALKAIVTPQVFLLNTHGETVYCGAIDDWALSLGKNKRQATKNYLNDAITNTLKGEIINNKFVTPVGCYIETKK